MKPMGWTSEMVARAYNVPRQKQDEYALISHTRAFKVSHIFVFPSLPTKGRFTNVGSLRGYLRR